MTVPVTPVRRQKIGFVVGSGALKCAAAVGLWKVLVREKIPIDMFVGASGGSIYTSVLALGWDIKDVEAQHGKFWKDSFARYSYKSLLKAMLPRVFGFGEGFGLVDDRRINSVLNEVFGDARIEDASIPLHLVATDLLTGDEVVLSRGRVVDAVRASVAIPFALRPWRVNDRLLYDGGASAPLPIDVAVREGCDIIIAMGFENPLTVTISSPMHLVWQTSAITVNHFLRSTYAFYNLAHHAEVIPIMPAFDRPVGLRDDHLLPWIVERGEEAAERDIPYLKRLLNRPEPETVSASESS